MIEAIRVRFDSLVRQIHPDKVPDITLPERPDLINKKVEEPASQFFVNPETQRFVEQILYMAPHGEL